MEKWLKAFPVPEQSPAHHVRNMCLSVGGYYVPPGEFFRRIQWFTNVKKVTVQGKEMFDGCLEIPLYAKVPQSVTSLTIEARVMGLELMRDVVVQLPDLDHSSQSGSSTTESRKSLRRLGAAIRVGFGGRPRLRDESTDDEVLNMLLEVPNDLHLTEVCVYADRDCHLSTVKLAKAGRKAFAMLSYGGSIHGESCPFPPPSFSADIITLTPSPSTGHSEAFDQPFNFSKFSRLEEVSFDIHWVHRDLQWIPLSLATLKPETSPRLSKIYLSFSGPAYYYHSRGMGTALEESANKIAHELTRIEDEYGGAADLIVALDAAFTQLDAVDVRFCFGMADDPTESSSFNYSLQVLRRWEPSD